MSHRLGPASLLALAAVLGAPRAQAGASMLLRYDAAYMANQSWYEGVNNEKGVLAWGEGYVLESLVEGYLASADPHYLVELVDHADAALDERDSVRGVVDYRSKSLPCWRATKYSTKPYCWAVHTGMIATPLVEFAALVKERPELATIATHDGKTFADKATLYLAAAEDAAAVHLDEWKTAGADDGYYIFRPDMSFYPSAGSPIPLNMMNAMGLLHLALARVSSSAAAHLEKARRLTHHFLNNKTTLGGGYYWNYLGGAYVAPGEDISHGSLNARFLSRAAEQNVVVTDKSKAALARTFMDGILVDTATFSDHLGGDTNTNKYLSQVATWAVTSDVSVHAVARDNLADITTTSNAGQLFGMSLLAHGDFTIHSFSFYDADWQDDGDHRTATAQNANILVESADPTEPILARIRYKSPVRTKVDQWDGAAYHTVTILPPSANFTVAHVPFVPAHGFAYQPGKALFQFEAPAGFALEEPIGIDPPAFTSTPPKAADPMQMVVYQAEASGWAPRVWKLEGPGAVSAQGEVSFTAPPSGPVAFKLTVTNDAGSATQSFTVEVKPASTGAGGSAGASSSSSAGGSLSESASSSANQAPQPGESASSGCALSGSNSPSGAIATTLFAAALAFVRQRSRRPRRA